VNQADELEPLADVNPHTGGYAVIDGRPRLDAIVIQGRLARIPDRDSVVRIGVFAVAQAVFR
jgi:hypothetical protein